MAYPKSDVCKVCGIPREEGTTYALCKEHRLARNNTTCAKWRASMSEDEKRAYLARVRLCQLKSRLKKLGLTLEYYNTVLSSQGYSCAICLSPEPGGKGGWHIDHDHITNQFRGLLCHNCNLALGNFKDSITILTNAINYLRKSFET